MKRLLSIALVAILLLGVAIPAVSVAETKTGVVHGGWLRLRSAASFDASTISSYYTGTVVTILSTTGSWYEVRTPDGRTGYMYSAYVTVTGSDSGGSGTGTSTVWSSNGYGVRMRSGPGTGYRVLAVYPVGTKVTVLQQGSYWSHIQVGSLRGYMMNQFLTGGSIPETTTGADATVWSSNGYGVRLRTGPSKSYSIIGVYSVGTSVKVLEKGSVWSYIQIGSRTGYMMTEFLIFNPVSKEVTSVTLNYKTPVAGSTLAVASLTPAGASVSYKWVCAGTTVGTGSSLYVKDTWADEPITLTVTGKDGYTGSASVTTNKVLASGVLQGVTLNIGTENPVVGNVLKVVETDPEGALYSCKWTITRANGKSITSTQSTYKVVVADKGETITLDVTGNAPFSGELLGVWTGTVPLDGKGKVLTADIVNTTNPNNTTGYASVGDKLSASYTPAVATVSYKWLVDIGDTKGPQARGYGSTYTVPDKAISVQLEVTGTGYYEEKDGNGDLVSYSSSVLDVNPNAVTLISIKLTPNTASDSKITYPMVDDLVTAVVKDKSDQDVANSLTFDWYVGTTRKVVAGSYTYTPDINDVGKTINAIAYGDGNAYTGKLTSNKTAVVKAELTGVEIKSSSGQVVSGAILVAETDPINATGKYEWFGSKDNFASEKSIGTGTTLKLTATLAVAYSEFKVVVTPSGNYYSANKVVSPTVSINGTTTPAPPGTYAVMAPMTLPEEGATETPTETETTVPTETESTLPTETESAIPTDTPTDEPTDLPVQDSPAPAVAPVEPVTYSLSLRQEDGKLTASVQPLDLITMTVQYAWYDEDNNIINGEAAAIYTIRDGDVGKEITVKVKLTVGTNEPIDLSKKITVIASN